MIIFPEHDVPYNAIVSEFETRFVDIAQLYHKRQGKTLPFVPLYIAPNLKSMYIGKPIYFNPNASMEEERQRICRCLMEEITAQAVSLPRHIVVPYRNIPKKQYPWSREESS